MLKPSTSLAVDTKLAAEEFFFDVFINDQPKGIVLVLRSENRFFVGAQDLRRWRLRFT